MKITHSRTSRRPGRLLVIAAAAVATVASQFSLMAPASADTAGTPDPVVTASFGAQTNVVPSGGGGTAATGTAINGLVNGSSISVTATTGAGNLAGVDARLCRPGQNIQLQSQFNPSQGGNCIDVPMNGASDDLVVTSAAPANTTVTFPFRVGVGTVTVAYGAGLTRVITCGPGNPCALWLKVSVNTAVHSSGAVWKHYDLNYAAAATVPAAPSVVTATGGNGQVTVDWDAPGDGGSAITQYTVTLTGAGGPFTQVVAAPATVHTFTGLANFQTYSATVTATNAVGTSPASAPVTANTGPTPAPSNVTATAGDGQATVSWTPADTTGLTGYRVTATPTAGAPIVALTGSTAPNHVFTGLTNGTTYTFVVEGVYGANFGPASAPSAPVLVQSGLNGGDLIQEIDVRRPQGGLVFTQICGPRTPLTGLPNIRTQTSPGSDAPSFGADPDDDLYGQYPYPVDANGDAIANNPTTCGVNLGTAVRIPRGQPGGGQFFEAKGFMNQVTVVNTRDDDVEWNVNGVMGQFNSGPNFFTASRLGWAPIKTYDTEPFDHDDLPTPDYDMTVTPGSLIGPKGAPVVPGGNGLNVSRNLAKATAGAALGEAILDADLTVWIPVTANTGTYRGILTLTAV